MAEDGVADDPTHDEPDPSGIGPVVTQDVDDQEVAAAASARADHQPEVTTAGEPMGRGKHGRGARAGVEPRGLRPPGSCGPCGDVRTGCCARHGCACAAGIRAPCGGGGCSAGTYACSRALSDGGQGRSRRRRPDRPLATDSAGRGSVKGSGLRPAPPTHAPVERPRDEPGRSVDMRHPSTPGDRGTVRAASPRRQIATGAWTGGPVGCGYPPYDGSPATGSVGSRQPVDSVLLGSRDRGYVRPSSSFPAFGSDQDPGVVAVGVLSVFWASDLR